MAAEKLAVELVHGCEVREVGEKDRRLDDRGPCHAGRIEHGADVRQNLRRLFPDPTRHQLAGGRIERNLTGQEHEVASPHRLRVGTDGARREVGVHDVHGAVGMTRPPGARKAAGRRARYLAFVGLAASLVFVPPVSGEDGARARVRHLDVRIRPIFDQADDPTFGGFPYSWVNSFKLPTYDYVVRDEVLLRPGDPVDERLLRESERNIRALGYLREVHVEAVPVEPGWVDLVVVAQETWTFQPQFNVAGGGGRVVGTAGLQENDFLGLGKQMRAFYTHEVERDQVQLQYVDPRILRSRYKTALEFDQLTDGRFRYASLERPFFSYDTRVAYGASGFDNLSTDHLYDEGETIREWRHAESAVSATLGWRINAAPSVAHRLIASYSYHEDQFTERDVEPDPDEPLPEDRRRSGLGLTWQWVDDDYVTRRNIRSFGVQEDYALGWNSSLGFAVQPAALGSVTDTQSFAATWHHGLAGDRYVILVDLGVTSRIHDARTENLVGSWWTEAYFTGLPRQTIAFEWRGEASHDRDAEDRFVMGGLNGLRGYPDRFVNGDGGTLVHLEDRVFIWDRILGLASLGAVGFYDAALPIDEDEPIEIAEIKQSVGLGLRVGLPASAIGKVLRLDVGFALNSTGDEPRLNVSFGTGQVFDLSTRLR